MFTSSEANYHSQSTKSDTLKFVSVSEQGAETRFSKETATLFRPKVSLMLINHHDQLIELQKTQNLKLCLGTDEGSKQAKIEKISILE